MTAAAAVTSGAAAQLTVPETLLEVRDVARHFDVSGPLLSRALSNAPKLTLKAVDGISFTIRRGETLSLVGESGCGKTTVARLIVGLYQPTRGQILFEGTDLTSLKSRRTQRPFRRRMQMIFQDPYASLNPRWRVRDIVAEPIRAFGLARNGQEVRDRVAALLRQVGLGPADGEKFPHEFSGGQRQRISIARALSSRPEFLVCDEPTSALDVSVQAQILNLMKDLQRELGLTYLFISHNLAVVRHISTRVGVMYLGKLVEVGSADAVYEAPRHPYTKGLIDSAPNASAASKGSFAVRGELPSAINPPSGCRFRTRCPIARDVCAREEPSLHRIDGRQQVACHFPLPAGAAASAPA